MEKIIKETKILNLAFEISISSCEGCIHNYGAQHGHSCLNPFFYNLALEKAIGKGRLKIGTLARQMLPNKVKFFMEAFKDAAPKQNGYLLIDLKQSTEERNRILTWITSDDLRIIHTSKD
ncbi:unnamed protein product [Brachionus calyciflorus]|uniref:Uncharacterized protein n=1 Tax=Brachionus calyciflorus TaxID=104777 RepID=A0A814DNU4_9BILA|nr:unnamed protein product [Brachionus calyciflorus]